MLSLSAWPGMSRSRLSQTSPSQGCEHSQQRLGASSAMLSPHHTHTTPHLVQELVAHNGGVGHESLGDTLPVLAKGSQDVGVVVVQSLCRGTDCIGGVGGGPAKGAVADLATVGDGSPRPCPWRVAGCVHGLWVGSGATLAVLCVCVCDDDEGLRRG